MGFVAGRPGDDRDGSADLRKVDLDPRVIAKHLGLIGEVIEDVDGSRLRDRYKLAWEYMREKPYAVEAGRGSKGKSDPTGSIVATQEQVRKAVEEAARAITVAHEAIDFARDRMRFVFRGPHPEKQETQMVSDVELREAREAKRKRDLQDELASLEQRQTVIRRELG